MSGGYVLLSVLLVVALVMVAAATALAVAAATTTVSHADEQATDARAAAEEGLALALEGLRWGWVDSGSTVNSGEGTRASYEAEVAGLPSLDAWLGQRLAGGRCVAPVWAARAYEVVCVGTCGAGRQTVRARVVVTPDALPRGLVVQRDLDMTATVSLSGCGAYVGGDVSGREHLEFTSPPGLPEGLGVSPDLACGGLWSEAGLHAGGCIHAGGAEVHDGQTPWSSDDDGHTSGGPPAWLVSPPTSSLMAALAERATSPGPALRDDVLDLSLLPPRPDEGSGMRGVVVMVSAGDAGIVIEGDRRGVAGARPLTLVVHGDCAVMPGASAEPTAGVRGALIVTGDLAVAAPLQIEGSLFAGRLVVTAPLLIETTDVVADTEQEYAPGASNVLIASWNE